MEYYFSVIKVKVKLEFTLEQTTKAQRMGGYICSSTFSLTSALDGGGCSETHSGRFTSEKYPVPIAYDFVRRTKRLCNNSYQPLTFGAGIIFLIIAHLYIICE